jgi:hypothetical protein
VADGANPAEHYVAVFNLGETKEDGSLPCDVIGIPARSVWLRDLWAHKDLGKSDMIPFHLARHASVLYRVRSE